MGRDRTLKADWRAPSPRGYVDGFLARATALRAAYSPHVSFLAALGALTLLAGLPLFQFKLMSGHDSLAYLPRYVEFYQGLRDGEIVPRWAADLGAGYGEPTFNFNPPALYYLVSAFHAIGFTFIASEDLAVFVLLLAAGAGMYLLACDVFGRHGGLVAAVAYVFSPFLLMRLYVGHALADFTAFAFMPYAFWAISGIDRGSTSRRFLTGAVAVALLMLSSISVAVMVLPALALFLALKATSGKDLAALLRGGACVALGLGLSAFFWLPAIRETQFVHISRREAGSLNFHNHFVYIWQLVYSPWGYGLSVPGWHDGLSFAVGPVHLLLTGVALLLVRRIWRASAPAGALVAASLVIVVGSVFFATNASLFIWEHVSVLHPLQFPWRFLTLIALATSLFCGVPFLLLRDAPRQLVNVLMVALIAAIFVLNFRHADPQTFLKTTDADYSPHNIATEGLAATAREFEPIDVQQFPSTPAQEPLTVTAGIAAYRVIERTPILQSFRIHVDKDAQLRLSTFYFPGWKVYVDDGATAVSHSNSQGLMEFRLAPGDHNVRVAFEDTPIRHWSTLLSLLCLVLLITSPALDVGLRRAVARLRPPAGLRSRRVHGV
jgi:hypothetical protein